MVIIGQEDTVAFGGVEHMKGLAVLHTSFLKYSLYKIHEKRKTNVQYPSVDLNAPHCWILGSFG